MNIPDQLTDVDKVAVSGVDLGSGVAETAEWIVRLEKRDQECRFYFIDKSGNVNARLSSAMKMPKDVARQYAKAISELHRVYKGKAMLYSTMRKMKESSR